MQGYEDPSDHAFTGKKEHEFLRTFELGQKHKKKKRKKHCNSFRRGTMTQLTVYDRPISPSNSLC